MADPLAEHRAPEDRHASWLEPFFDLVAGIGALAHRTPTCLTWASGSASWS